MKRFLLLLALVGLGLCSCERHEWESDPPKDSDTINLFKHEEHADHDEKEGDHSKEDADEEKDSE